MLYHYGREQIKHPCPHPHPLHTPGETCTCARVTIRVTRVPEVTLYETRPVQIVTLSETRPVQMHTLSETRPVQMDTLSETTNNL
jgi:hypothetical protein